MVYLCVNRDCNLGPQQPTGARFCVGCHDSLSFYPAENPSSYQPSFPASRDLPRHGNLEFSISTISASSPSGAGTGPSSVYEQMRPSYPSSEYGLLETRQSPFPKSSPKPPSFSKDGPDSANFRKREDSRLPNMPPAFNSNPNSHVNSSQQAGSSTWSILKPWSPSDAKSNKDGTRSCIPCYRRGKKCIISEGQENCEYCSEKSLYCRGPVNMAPGFIPQYCISKLLGRTGAAHALLNVIIEDNPFFDVRITLMDENNTSSSLAQTNILKTETLQMDLRNLRDDTHHGIDQEAWERFFDVIHSRPENPEGEGRDRNANIVPTFGRLCRHFVAALVLLGSPELSSTFDVIAGRNSAGPFLMLETIRQLYHIASSSLVKMFDELKKYAVAVAPRHRLTFNRETLHLGLYLGMCHHALSHFRKAPMGRTDFPSDLAGFYDIPPSLIEQFKSLGDTFGPNGFRERSQTASSERFGLHIDLDAGQGYASHGTGKITFIEGFELLLSSSLSSRTGRASSVSSRSPPAVRNFPTSRGLLERANLSAQSSHEGDESRMGAGQPSTNDAESQVNAGHSIDPPEPETMKEKTRVKVVQLQQERDTAQKKVASLDEQIARHQLLFDMWSRPSTSGEFSDAEGREERMLPFTPPVRTDAQNNPLLGLETTLGLEKPVVLSYIDEDTSLGLPFGVDHEDWPVMDLDMLMPIPRSSEHVEKNHTNDDQHFPLKKRKRALGNRQNPQQTIGRFCDDADATMPDAMDVEPSASIAHQTSTSVSPFKRQPLQTFPAGLSFLTRKSQMDTKAAGHTDFASEIPLANIKSQRPQSWPGTLQWHESIGVSVKALRETFEKLALGSMEPTPTRSLKHTSLLG